MSQPKPPNKTDKVYFYLKNYILTNHLKKGDPLFTEEYLRTTFDVSRVTVRNAFEKLKKEGVISQVKGSGTFVGSGNVKEISNATYLPLILTHQQVDTRGYEIIQGAEKCLSKSKFLLTINLTNLDYKLEEKAIIDHYNNGCRCMLVMPISSKKNSEFFLDMINKGVIFIFIDTIPNNISSNFVESDNTSGGYIATNHLISLAHKKIAVVSYNNAGEASSIFERTCGHVQALKEHNISINKDYIKLGCTHINLEEKIGTLLSLPDPPTSIFALSDVMATSILSILNQKNVRVPEDISLIGFDNITITETKLISTINQDFFNIGYKATQIALEVLSGNNDALTHYKLPVSLVKRKSTSFI